MLFDFTIDETFTGQTIGPVDGFVVKLRRTQACPYDPPSFSEATQQFTAGRFVLRASGEFRKSRVHRCARHRRLGVSLRYDRLGAGGRFHRLSRRAGGRLRAKIVDLGNPTFRCPVQSRASDELVGMPHQRVSDQREAILCGAVSAAGARQVRRHWSAKTPDQAARYVDAGRAASHHLGARARDRRGRGTLACAQSEARRSYSAARQWSQASTSVARRKRKPRGAKCLTAIVATPLRAARSCSLKCQSLVHPRRTGK